MKMKQLKNTITQQLKKYSGGHFFSTGIEREVAQEFIDSMKNKIPSQIERHIN